MPILTGSSGTSCRVAFAAMAMLPLVAWIVLLMIAAPDLKGWLDEQTRGWSRPDTFRFVNGLALPFTFSLAFFSSVSASLILVGHWREQTALYAGPVGLLLIEIAIEDLSDPDFSLIMATQCIALGVSAVVTLLWIWRNSWRRHL